ncbi:MAG: DNA topoisomerase VI subunit B [Candidatus Aenigmatarchaeota archaeon]
MSDTPKTAHQMAEQREISISQFFEKNRHLLGYDNKIKALLTIVKEAVDNALDATEEARILPDIYVKVEEIEKEKYRIIIKDNGPGILKKHIPNIFGKLLYGSKFHRLKQNRGQQGIGISGCVLYSQLTTGEPTVVYSSIGDGKTHKYALKIDVKTNEPKILEEETIEDGDNKWHGVQITFVAEGVYREHKQSVLEFLKQVAIANPYANIIFDSPNGRVEFKRSVNSLPVEAKEIQPHLDGVEVGILSRMLHETKARTCASFFTTEFSRVGKLTAEQICKAAGVDPKISPRKISQEEVLKLAKAIKEVKITRPPTDCLSPLGTELIESGLKKELNPEWVSALSRPPSVYRGWPFQIEVGIAYGGSITEPTIMRFANKVPLLYQQGDCAITKAAMLVDWKRYGIPGDKLPEGPVALFIHIASVWVPFTSESKEAVSSYDEIIREIKLALQDCARRLSIHLSSVRRAQMIEEKKNTLYKYAYETAAALEELTGVSKKKIQETLMKIVEARWNEIIAEDTSEENDSTNSEKENGDGENGSEE